MTEKLKENNIDIEIKSSKGIQVRGILAGCINISAIILTLWLIIAFYRFLVGG